jgi:hypothetical protein
MIDLSVAGFVGALVGTVVAAFAYVPLLASIEGLLRAGAGPGHEASSAAKEEETARSERALLRRAVLAADILVFAGLGYWLGALTGI